MTPSNTVANMAIGLIPALSSADVLDVIATALNELNGRGDEVEIKDGRIIDRWAEIALNDKQLYSTVFYDYSIAEQATETFRPQQLELGAA